MTTKTQMLTAVDDMYRESPQANAIFGAQATEVDKRRAEARDLLEQLEVGKATWALENYERALGIQVQPTKPIAERRELIIARMRGTANTTIKQLKSVAESFYGGKVEVRTDYPKYTIYVKFVSNLGTPANLKDVEKAIREIVPAHIAFMFEFSYLLVREIEGMTLSNLQAQTLDKFAF